MNNLCNDAFYGNPARRPRQYRPLDVYTDGEIHDRFWFRRDSINFIINVVYNDLARPTRRNHALTVEMQVLIVLTFFACGSFHKAIGDVIGVDKSTVSRTMYSFCNAIKRKSPEFIRFPYSDNNKHFIKQGFFKISGFPSTIGCIDCTHVQIADPSENKNDFVNRKGYHSIDVQAIADHQDKFLDVVAKWPESTHDSFIFRTPDVKYFLEQHHTSIDKGIILDIL